MLQSPPPLTSTLSNSVELPIWAHPLYPLSARFVYVQSHTLHPLLPPSVYNGRSCSTLRMPRRDTQGAEVLNHLDGHFSVCERGLIRGHLFLQLILINFQHIFYFTVLVHFQCCQSVFLDSAGSHFH